ncbi:MAG: hypothetical protein K2P78_14640 [Gemmataceae bacterium]|nr:hypothetical protein [Gemmataceae bacterium]
MDKTPKQTGKKPVRKPFRYIRVREPAASIADDAAKEKLEKLAAWVTRAVIEKLEREGKWPPPKSTPA